MWSFSCSNPIKCGQTIRLGHAATKRNLHSHHFTSPLSHNLEVSAFGENGEGDEGEYFRHSLRARKVNYLFPVTVRKKR